MSLPRHNPPRDQNEPAVIEALERCGFAVSRVSAGGIPDLLVSRRGHWWTVEVKMPKGKPTPAQTAFRGKHKAPVQTITTPMEAVEWAGTVP